MRPFALVVLFAVLSSSPVSPVAAQVSTESQLSNAQFSVSSSGEISALAFGATYAPLQSAYSNPLWISEVGDQDAVVAYPVGGGFALLHVSIATGSLQQLSSSVTTQLGAVSRLQVEFDPIASRLVAYVPGTLSVWSSSVWAPGLSLSGIAWTAIGPVTSFDVLSGLEAGLRLKRVEGTIGGINQQVLCLSVGVDGFRHFSAALVPTPGGAGFIAIQFDELLAFEPQAVINSFEAREGAQVVEVVGGSGFIGTLKLNGVILSSGFVIPSGGSLDFALAAPLEVGDLLEIVGQMGVTLDSYFVGVRYENTGFNGSYEIAKLVVPQDTTLGNAHFSARAYFSSTVPLAPGSVQSVSGSAIAGVAFRPASGLDPLVNVPSGILIDTTVAAMVPVVGFFDDEGTGFLDFHYPIPADPIIAGEVFLLQFALDDGSGVALSDIVGVKIR